MFASGGILSFSAKRKYAKKGAPAGGFRLVWWKILARVVQGSRGVHEGFCGPIRKVVGCFKAGLRRVQGRKNQRTQREWIEV